MCAAAAKQGTGTAGNAASVPAVWKPVIAILASDIHLSLKAPLARRAEPSWPNAMRRPLEELGDLANRHGDCPVFYAGDIFDRYNPPPELLTFALTYLPTGFAVCGQHDVPHHNLMDVGKSAFGVLTKVDLLRNLHSARHHIRNLLVQGFPWGIGLKETDRTRGDYIHLAVVHKYCWMDGKAAPYMDRPEGNADAIRKALKGFDVIHTGDNHQGFIYKNVCNAGTLMRRHANERDYKPMVGLLHSDGNISPHYLDVSQDKFVESMTAEDEAQIGTFREFTEELSRLEENDDLDFGVAIRRAANKVDKPARMVIMRALEDAMGK